MKEGLWKLHPTPGVELSAVMLAKSITLKSSWATFKSRVNLVDVGDPEAVEQKRTIAKVAIAARARYTKYSSIKMDDVDPTPNHSRCQSRISTPLGTKSRPLTSTSSTASLQSPPKTVTDLELDPGAVQVLLEIGSSATAGRLQISHT